MNRVLKSLAFVVTVSFASAQAQESADSSFSATFDMQLPPASVADSPGPLSLVYNPAELAWDGSFSVLYIHQEALDDRPVENQLGFFSVSQGRADGLLLSLRNLGFGVQWIRPQDEGNKTEYMKYSLAIPLLSRGRWFSLACGIELLDPTRTNEGVSIDFMAGGLIRPFRFLSFGIVGRNLGKAKMADMRSHRILDLGMAIRPWVPEPERLTLAADLRLVEEAKDPSMRFTAALSLVDGLNLLSTVDTDGNFGAGLQLDLLRMGAGGFTSFSNTSGVKPANMLFSVRASSDNHPGFVLSRKKTAEIKIDDQLVLDHGSAWRLFKTPLSLHGVVRAIHRAARDKRVDSLLFRIQDHELGWTHAQEIREALRVFKKTGKKVFFHLEQAGNLNYYLASMGDGIYLAPEALFAVTGPKVDALFLGGTLDMVGAKAEYQRVGKYKLAPEQLTNREPSKAKLEEMNSMADHIAEELYGAIAEGRDMRTEEATTFVDKGFMHATEAKQAGLVDELVDYDELGGVLGEKLKHRISPLRGYPYQRWHSKRWGKVPVIVVVHAVGTIGGNGILDRNMNARKISELLSALEKSTSIDAVVLRVNSPGGSGFASDMIWRKVIKLKKKKPVIVSMGPLAASGGYYISCGADTIVANPSTITGSIGVFSLFFDLSKLYEKLGIGHAVVKRGEIADLSSTFRGRTEKEMVLIKKYVDDFYSQFIEKVAQGRGMKVDEIDRIGQGRVWTGKQAKQKGLVDELGGLYTAVLLAKERIGLTSRDEARVIHLPRPRFSLSVLLQDLGLVPKSQLPVSKEALHVFHQLSDLYYLSSQPVLAMLPFLFTIH